ncbi:MAG: endonuclease/exonuclease/phosphatase family protein [Woeseiaceae bacterium]|nr:endonuclease/exonuclease/phosphatase family protein [Woeseiaceae bacterium]
MRARLIPALAGAVASFALAGCAAPDESATAPPEPGQDGIRVMTFNIEWGGTGVSFDKVVEAIRVAEADVVGIQEAEGNLERLAGELGWHFDLRNYVVSRFPLLEPPGADGRYVLVETAPGEVFALANLHLPSDPYGPDLVRDGAQLAEVLEVERSARLPALQPWLDAVAPLVAAGMPVVVTGDFNAPPHTDWASAVVGSRPYLRFAVDWPVSRAMEAAGFRDAWRTVHPDVVARPGLTWWAARPPLPDYAPGPGDPEDRIDQVWIAGPVEARDAIIVGETDGPGVALSVSPWPSDHRAVVATLAIEAAAAPALVTTDRRVYAQGVPVRIIGRAGGAGSLAVTIRNAASDEELQTATLAGPSWQTSWAPPAPGHYAAIANAGGTELLREFWVLAADAEPEVTVAGAEAGPVVISWTNAPGHRNDYLALFEAGVPASADAILAWAYVDARPEGSLPLNALGPAGWCLGSADGCDVLPGRYVVRLMKDDGYDVLAESPVFAIR